MLEVRIDAEIRIKPAKNHRDLTGGCKVPSVQRPYM